MISVLVEGSIISKHNTKSYNLKDALVSSAMGIGNIILGLLSKIITFAIFTYTWEYFRLFTIPFV
jgi:hypothetical protein